MRYKRCKPRKMQNAQGAQGGTRNCKACKSTKDRSKAGRRAHKTLKSNSQVTKNEIGRTTTGRMEDAQSRQQPAYSSQQTANRKRKTENNKQQSTRAVDSFPCQSGAPGERRETRGAETHSADAEEEEEEEEEQNVSYYTRLRNGGGARGNSATAVGRLGRIGQVRTGQLCQRRQEWASVGRCGKVCVSAWVELGGTEY